MLNLDEIEELFKSTELIKNRKMVEALLHNVKMSQNMELSPEQRELAHANIKAITSGGKPAAPASPKKIKKPKDAVASAQPVNPASIQPAAPLNPAVPQSSAGQIKLKYSPAYQHYGVTQEHWDAAGPDAHQGLFAHHNEVMAGKHPDSMHIKTAVEQAKANMIKSADNLYNLFLELKKHL